MPTDPFARYAKQTRFAPLGEVGQAKLSAGHALLCGCGALGSVIASTLVRAGVGKLTVVDRDFLETSNLQRQVLFDENDVREGLPKAIAAANHLRAANSTVEVDPVVADVTAANLPDLAVGCDIVLDGTDNFETRLLLNDYAIREAKPWVYGGVIGAEGRVMPVVPGETACLACLIAEPPAAGEAETCDSAGVLGPAVGVVASLQAMEAIKLLAGLKDSLAAGLTVVDLWAGRWRRLAVPRDPACRCCGARSFDWLEGRRGSRAVILCGRGAVQISPSEGSPPADLVAMRAKLAQLGAVSSNAYLLRLQYDGHEVTVFADGRAIIGGVEDETQARSVWNRLLGG